MTQRLVGPYPGFGTAGRGCLSRTPQPRAAWAHTCLPPGPEGEGDLCEDMHTLVGSLCLVSNKVAATLPFLKGSQFITGPYRGRRGIRLCWCLFCFLRLCVFLYMYTHVHTRTRTCEEKFGVGSESGWTSGFCALVPPPGSGILHGAFLSTPPPGQNPSGVTSLGCGSPSVIPVPPGDLDLLSRLTQ